MNEDVIPAESERGCLSTPVSGWWILLAAAVLVWLAFQSGPMQPNAKRSDTRVIGKGIADAVSQFYGDYNRLPKPPSAKQGEDSDIDTSSGGGLIQILLGREPANSAQQNTRNINYLEGIKNAKALTGTRDAEAKGSGKWIGGLVFEEDSFSAVDAWGGYYRVRFDSNYDGEMLNPNEDEVGEGRMKLPNRVIIWSAGKDGKWDTWDDNIKSWD